MRRLAALAVLAVAVVAPGAAATTQSGLEGTVTRGPISPICIAERPCDAPVPGLTLVFTRGGNEAGRVRTTSAGRYRVDLAPGAYAVTSLPVHRLEPTGARVVAGRVHRVDFSFDTGIR